MYFPHSILLLIEYSLFARHCAVYQGFNNEWDSPCPCEESSRMKPTKLRHVRGLSSCAMVKDLNISCRYHLPSARDRRLVQHPWACGLCSKPSKKRISKINPCLTHVIQRMIVVSSCSFLQYGYFLLRSLPHFRASYLLRQFSDLIGLFFPHVPFLGNHSKYSTKCRRPGSCVWMCVYVCACTCDICMYVH